MERNNVVSDDNHLKKLLDNKHLLITYNEKEHNAVFRIWT